MLFHTYFSDDFDNKIFQFISLLLYAFQALVTGL